MDVTSLSELSGFATVTRHLGTAILRAWLKVPLTSIAMTITKERLDLACRRLLALGVPTDSRFCFGVAD